MGEKMSLQDAMHAVAEKCTNDERAWAGWRQVHTHLTQPAQAVDVGAVHRVIEALGNNADVCESRDLHATALHLRNCADKLTAALAGKQP